MNLIGVVCKGLNATIAEHGGAESARTLASLGFRSQPGPVPWDLWGLPTFHGAWCSAASRGGLFLGLPCAVSPPP